MGRHLALLIRVDAADGVDDNLLEAARIDSEVESRIFFQVTARLLQKYWTSGLAAGAPRADA